MNFKINALQSFGLLNRNKLSFSSKNKKPDNSSNPIIHGVDYDKIDLSATKRKKPSKK